VLICINLTLGAILWFGFLTDYSFTGVYLDLTFPPIVGLIGFVSFRLAARTCGRLLKWLQRLSAIPSLCGGCLPTVLAAILIIPPFMGILLYAVDDITGETRIQQEISPDGVRTVGVYFRRSRVFSEPFGRAYVRVQDRRFPLIERDIYYDGSSAADEYPSDYLYWLDNETLYIIDAKSELKVGVIDSEIPTFISLPLTVINRIRRSATRRSRS